MSAFAFGGMYRCFDAMLEHNRVDMRVWLKKEKTLFTVEMSTPWDENMQAVAGENHALQGPRGGTGSGIPRTSRGGDSDVLDCGRAGYD